MLWHTQCCHTGDIIIIIIIAYHLYGNGEMAKGFRQGLNCLAKWQNIDWMYTILVPTTLFGFYVRAPEH